MVKFPFQEARTLRWYELLCPTDKPKEELAIIYAAYVEEAYTLAPQIKGQDEFRRVQAFLKQIDIDLPRTRAESIRDEALQTLLASKGVLLDPVLRRLLYAFTIRYSSMGYTQGINSIAAMLGASFESENDAFWTLTGIVDRVLPPNFFSLQHEFAVLKSVTQSLAVDHCMLEDMVAVCGVGAVMNALDMQCTKWFVTLFVDYLPLESMALVWDKLAIAGASHERRDLYTSRRDKDKGSPKGSLVLATAALACFRLVPPPLYQDLLEELSETDEIEYMLPSLIEKYVANAVLPSDLAVSMADTLADLDARGGVGIFDVFSWGAGE